MPAFFAVNLFREIASNSFYKGLARIQDEAGYGYIDTQGNWVWYKKYNNEDSLKCTYLHYLADFYRETKMYDKAEPIYLKLVSQRDQRGFVYDLLGLFRLYKEKKEDQKAENLLINNIDIIESKNFNDNYIQHVTYPSLCSLYSDLSEIYKKRKDYKRANYYDKLAIYYHNK